MIINSPKNIGGGIFIALLVLLVIFFIIVRTPHFENSFSTVIYDKNGQLLGSSIADDEQWRFPEIQAVPKKFVQAITLYEDKRFFSHPGIDLFALIRALRENIKSHSIKSGASTITMQVARLSHPKRNRTLCTKFIEIIAAFKLECISSKNDILTLYVSHAPFGGNVVGLEAAAWRYFGRQPDNLSWAETATLAVLPNSPSLIHPGRNRDILFLKRNNLLDLLLAHHKIDSLSWALALQEPLPARPMSLPSLAPHLLENIKQSKNKESRIFTTLQKDVQVRADQILNCYYNIYAQNDINNIAVLIIEVNSGDVLAYLGNVQNQSGDINHGYYVDLIRSQRSTGSILKPFLYASMIEAGEILPTTLVPDIPTRMGSFAPQNFNRNYEGAVPAFMALSRSLNVPSVRMLHCYGIDRFYGVLQSLGMTTLFRPASDYGLSLILGGAEGSLWELTSIYANMARMASDFNGNRLDKTFFQPNCFRDRSEISTSRQSPLGRESCWLTLQAMLEVTRPGIEQEWRQYNSSQMIAWKTGTSFGFRDAWAIGVTPKYAVGVWVGNADGGGRPGLIGVTTAGPILFELFDLLDKSEWFSEPESLVPIKVCRFSGYRAGEHCQFCEIIKSNKAGLESPLCPFCMDILCDSTGTWQVHSNCENIITIQHKKWFVLPPAMEWFYRQNHSDYIPLPPFRKDCVGSETINPSSMNLLFHTSFSNMVVPIELDGAHSQAVFEASHRQNEATIFWHLDEEYIESTQGMHQIAITPEPGRHVLTLVDEFGEQLEYEFSVNP